MSKKEVWIVKGQVTDPDAHPGSKVGDVEWQFSDAPPGLRSSSADYIDLHQGLRDHSGCVLYFMDEARFVVRRSGADGNQFQCYDQDFGSWMDGVFDSYDNAKMHCERLGRDYGPADVLNRVVVTPDAAKHAANLISELLGCNGIAANTRTVWLRYADYTLSARRGDLKSVSEALYALTSDADAITTEV